MRVITEIILHCSATEQGYYYTAKDIDKWHRARGFREIGYHYVVCLDGSIQLGRSEGLVGAHCTDHNAHSIGVCYVGGIGHDGRPADTRTSEQRKALVELLSLLHTRYPHATLHGHNEYARKACPSFYVRTDKELTAIFSNQKWD